MTYKISVHLLVAPRGFTWEPLGWGVTLEASNPIQARWEALRLVVEAATVMGGAVVLVETPTDVYSLCEVSGVSNPPRGEPAWEKMLEKDARARAALGIVAN